MSIPFDSEDGFNLFELMAVLMILGIILLIAIASYAISADRAAAVACASNRRQLGDAAEAFVLDQDRQPTTMGDLESYVKNFEQVALCPGGESASLVYHADSRTVTCPTHGD